MVRGVRSSWETLATNSLRISSFFRWAVTSCITAMALPSSPSDTGARYSSRIRPPTVSSPERKLGRWSPMTCRRGNCLPKRAS